jgi:hypothetical protein
MMKLSLVVATALLAGPCSSSTSDAPGANPSSTPPPAVATAGATGTATAAAAVAPKAPSTGPCATLAERCGKCPAGAA